MRKLRLVLTVAAGAATVVAGVSCGKAPLTPYTYYHDVAPIVTGNCAMCHNPDGIGPFDLTTYDALKSEATLVVPEITAKAMPPWMPGTDSQPMSGARGLTDAQIELITSWVKGGMPEGNPSDAPQETGPSTTFSADATLKMAQPYTPVATNGEDDYHCFVLDPQLTQDTAVIGEYIKPGDPRVVHHAVVYPVVPADQPALQQLVAQGGGNGYPCFGGDGILTQSSGQIIAAIGPGSPPQYYPAGTGVIIPAGSLLVMQIHYSLITVQHTTDQTTLELAYAPESSVNHAFMVPVVNFNFSIPPGAVQTVAEGFNPAKASATFDPSQLGIPAGSTLQVWGSYPHMHLHGTDINTVGTKADGTQSMWIHVPAWQFRWQQMYFFQQPILMQPGDTATLSCTFDNTAADQPVIDGVQETPQTLTFGEDTTDEMCINLLYMTLQK